MLETLKKLEQVQELDLQIQAAQRIKAEFPERLKAYDEEIKAIKLKQEEKTKISTELRKSHRQQLGALELNEDRAKRSEEKLTQIKTHDELQALQKEIESLKKHSALIQENAKKVDDEAKKIEDEIAGFQTQIDTIATKRDEETNKINSEAGIVDSDLSKLEAQRKAMIVGLDVRIMATYDRIRPARGGVGIALANGGTCKACNMKIPPQLYIEIQRPTEVELCPSCRRILIYKDANSKGL